MSTTSKAALAFLATCLAAFAESATNTCPFQSVILAEGVIEATLSQAGNSLRILLPGDMTLHRTRSHAGEVLFLNRDGYTCSLDGPGTNYYVIVHLGSSAPGVEIRSPTFDSPEAFLPATIVARPTVAPLARMSDVVVVATVEQAKAPLIANMAADWFGTFHIVETLLGTAPESANLSLDERVSVNALSALSARTTPGAKVILFLTDKLSKTPKPKQYELVALPAGIQPFSESLTDRLRKLR